MKILVVGGGGREHAIGHALSRSRHRPELFFAPGNPGTALLGLNVSIGAEDIPGLLAWVKANRPDLVVAGPEAPLVLGLSDEVGGLGIPVFGPVKAGARLEASKDFTKTLLIESGVPTAGSATFTEHAAALSYLREKGAPVVVKADGLAAGKGVTVCLDLSSAEQALDEAMNRRVFGEAGSKVVIEEYLEGEEASILAFTDGETVIPMQSAQDHKRVFDGDQGPNTGGMGAYSPAPIMTTDLEGEVLERILNPTLAGLRRRGIAYRGVLYAGLMITRSGPQVIEYNCRFGDPETEVVLPRLKTDLVDICMACSRDGLTGTRLDWDSRACAGVVMASAGYPGSYGKGRVIEGLDEAGRVKDAWIYHAGTTVRDGKTLTAGGRVLCVTGMGSGIREAVARAYEAVALIRFEGAHYRKDIAWRAVR